MPRRRLGVALLVPPPLDREIDGLRRALGDGGFGRIPPHLTLVPPVNVRAERIGEAVGVLRAAAARTRPFAVTVGPPATFLPDSPTVYLPVRDGGEDVHAIRDAVFVDPLARSLTWPFVPHVTLADDIEPARVPSALAALAAFSVEMAFDRVHLLEEGEERVWTSVADVPFAPPAVVGRGGLDLELTVTRSLDPEATAFVDAEWAAYDRARFGPEVAQPEPLVVTGRRRGAIVGVGRGWVANGAAHLADLVVAVDVRGQGVGSQLLAMFVSEVAARDATQVSLRTEAEGPAAAFYEARGWGVVARLPRYSYGRDFVHMVRRLT